MHLYWYKEKHKPQDVFVFYYAGHGYIHQRDKEFYLVSADVEDGNESLLKNGVAAKELQSFAVDIATQNKCLVDACQKCRSFEQMLKHDGEQQKALAVVSRSTNFTLDGRQWQHRNNKKEFGELEVMEHLPTLLQALKGTSGSE